MAVFGTLATVREQLSASPRFAIALAYVEELLRPGSPVHARLASVAVGSSQRIELTQGVFVMEQAYLTKPRSEGFFESHRKHVDVQVVVSGEEIMEVVDAGRIEARQAFDPERDLILYRDTEAASSWRMHPGEIGVFFPADVHMPGLRRGADAVAIRKAVVKVPVA